MERGKEGGAVAESLPPLQLLAIFPRDTDPRALPSPNFRRFHLDVKPKNPKTPYTLAPASTWRFCADCAFMGQYRIDQI